MLRYHHENGRNRVYICPLQLLRFEFSPPSSRRPVSVFNFNYERQAALNAALLKEALPDLPPNSGPLHKVRDLVPLSAC